MIRLTVELMMEGDRHTVDRRQAIFEAEMSEAMLQSWQSSDPQDIEKVFISNHDNIEEDLSASFKRRRVNFTMVVMFVFSLMDFFSVYIQHAYTDNNPDLWFAVTDAIKETMKQVYYIPVGIVFFDLLHLILHRFFTLCNLKLYSTLNPYRASYNERCFLVGEHDIPLIVWIKERAHEIPTKHHEKVFQPPAQKYYWKYRRNAPKQDNYELLTKIPPPKENVRYGSDKANLRYVRTGSRQQESKPQPGSSDQSQVLDIFDKKMQQLQQQIRDKSQQLVIPRPWQLVIDTPKQTDLKESVTQDKKCDSVIEYLRRKPLGSESSHLHVEHEVIQIYEKAVQTVEKKMLSYIDQQHESLLSNHRRNATTHKLAKRVLKSPSRATPKKSPEKYSNIATPRQSLEKTSTVTTRKKSPENNSTVTTRKKSPENNSTVTTRKKSPEKRSSLEKRVLNIHKHKAESSTSEKCTCLCREKQRGRDKVTASKSSDNTKKKNKSRPKRRMSLSPIRNPSSTGSSSLSRKLNSNPSPSTIPTLGENVNASKKVTWSPCGKFTSSSSGKLTASHSSLSNKLTSSSSGKLSSSASRKSSSRGQMPTSSKKMMWRF